MFTKYCALGALFFAVGCESATTSTSATNGCSTLCKDTEICDTATKLCVAVSPPCKVLCKTGEICSTTAKICIADPAPCANACPHTQACDIASNTCVAQTCKFPDSWAGDIQKITKFDLTKVDADGVTVDACDLDGDGAPDDAFAKVLLQVKSTSPGDGGLTNQISKDLANNVFDGTFVNLFQRFEPGSIGTGLYTLNLLRGKLDPAAAMCPTAADCKMLVRPTSYDRASKMAICPVTEKLTEISFSQHTLKLGGAEQVLPFRLPLYGIVSVALNIQVMSLKGEITGLSKWEATRHGKICGAILLSDLAKAEASITGELASKLGVANQFTLFSLIAKLKKAADVGGSATSKPNAVSIAFDFDTDPAKINGMAAAETP